MPLKINLETIRSGFDCETCWAQARMGFVPTPSRTQIVTMQKLLLSGSDVYGQLYQMQFDNVNKRWRDPTPCANLEPRNEADQVTAVMTDVTPKLHAVTGKLLLTGHVARYRDNKLVPQPRKRETSYAVYDEKRGSYSKWQMLEMPDEYDLFFNCGAGSTQRYDLEDGTILLPVYFCPNAGKSINLYSTVVKCSFDGEKLSYIEHGNELVVSLGRGLGEPSLIKFEDKYFLTLRNNFTGYVTQSQDGLNYETIKPWCFDDGELLGNYNTQQHWLRFGDKELYLVYTRRSNDNDNVFRHRAPLFIARVNTEKLCVIRESEQILVPNRGARLGNFGVCELSPTESWVTVTEWMQNDDIGFGKAGAEYCASFGSDNSVFLVDLKMA